MNAKVRALYRNGIPLSQDKLPEPVIGDLNLSVSKHPVTGRCTHEANIISDLGTSLLPDLYDVQCNCIAAHGLRLRGTIFTAKGQQVVQEWWCVILPPSVPKVSG